MDVKTIKEKYQTGTRIELINTDDPHTKLQSGERGTVDFVDDIGQVHIIWDCGSTLALIPGKDQFKKLKG